MCPSLEEGTLKTIYRLIKNYNSWEGILLHNENTMLCCLCSFGSYEGNVAKSSYNFTENKLYSSSFETMCRFKDYLHIPSSSKRISKVGQQSKNISCKTS